MIREKLSALLGRPVVLVSLLGLVVVLGLTSIGRGLSYIGPAAPDTAPSALESVHNIMPLPAWAGLWMIVGIGLVVSIVLHPAYIPALIVYGMLQTMWAGSFFVATFTGTSERGWLSGLNYLPEIGIALLLIIIGPLPRLDSLWIRPRSVRSVRR